MKIFITGVAGFLGSNLAEWCLKKNYQVSGCDNLVGGEKENFKDLDVEFFNIDCENLEEMTKAMKGVDVLCHAASYAHEGLSSVSPTLICRNNMMGSVATFTAAIKNNVKRIVFCSSTARYGSIKTPFKESDRPMPQDPYGIAKLAAEDILKNLAHTHNFEYNIVVPHNIIGIKQRYDDPYRNVASIMVNLMLQNREPIIYGDGNQTRELIFIDDAVDIILQSMSPATPKILNLSSGKPYKLSKYAQTICDIVGYDYNLIEWDKDAFVGSKNKKLINTHLKGYKFTSLKKGLKKTIKYYEDSISSSK